MAPLSHAIHSRLRNGCESSWKRVGLITATASSLHLPLRCLLVSRFFRRASQRGFQTAHTSRLITAKTQGLCHTATAGWTTPTVGITTHLRFGTFGLLHGREDTDRFQLTGTDHLDRPIRCDTLAVRRSCWHNSKPFAIRRLDRQRMRLGFSLSACNPFNRPPFRALRTAVRTLSALGAWFNRSFQSWHQSASPSQKRSYSSL
ncbi:MAG: hypothetical protein ACOCTG_00245 [Bacteroidota bacterium]